MSRKAMGLEGGDVTSPWQAALDHWWKAVSPAAPDASKQFMERMMEQGKSFFRMAETFLPGASGGRRLERFQQGPGRDAEGFHGLVRRDGRAQ